MFETLDFLDIEYTATQTIFFEKFLFPFFFFFFFLSEVYLCPIIL